MAFEIRKIGIILAVAVLYAIFVFSLGSALLPEREYPAICQEATEEERPYHEYISYRGEDVNCSALPPPSDEAIAACPGQLAPDYRNVQCPEQYTCNCYTITEDYHEREAAIQFWLGVILGAAAIVGGMLLSRGSAINDWIGTGFILGGLIALFIATMQYWGDIHRWARPFVIALELILVLWLAYRRFGPAPPTKRRK